MPASSSLIQLLCPRCSGKVVSAGTNGEIVQWQAFFFDPATSLASPVPVRRGSGGGAASEKPGPSDNPAPAILKNRSLVGLINARRNRKEDKIQRSLRSRDVSEPTLRRVGHEAPRGDGRVGGVDVFEMDYRVCVVGWGDFLCFFVVVLGLGSLVAGCVCVSLDYTVEM